jgi:Restriction endonuclease BglII
MGLDVIPQPIRDRYHIEERWHACAVLSLDCQAELTDILACLDQFVLLRTEIQEAGGRKSKITDRVEGFLHDRGWRERSIRVSRKVDDLTIETDTHKVDFFRGRVAFEMEWNSKDSVFSRDLNAFRLLHEHGVISVGVILTRMDELQDIFDALPDVWDAKNNKMQNIGGKYGASTTHWGKLIPKIDARGGGTCPLLLIGITRECYRDDLAPA